VLLVVEMGSRCSIPFIIEVLLKSTTDESPYVGLLIVILIVGVLFRHNNWRYGQYINLRIRTMLVKTLYRKFMRLGSKVLKNFDLSRAITTVTNDINSIELKLQFVFLAFTAPFTLIYCLVMLINWNGEHGIVGFIYFVSMFAFHMIINNKIKPYTEKRTVLSQ
jgi:ABC-type multidrug transport system fused ATPase/permease subunit